MIHYDTSNCLTCSADNRDLTFVFKFSEAISKLAGSAGRLVNHTLTAKVLVATPTQYFLHSGFIVGSMKIYTKKKRKEKEEAMQPGSENANQ